MLFRTVLIASLFVMLLFGQTTQAEPPLKITDVFVDFDAGQFIITGQNFGTNPVVTLNCCGDPTPFELDIVGTPTATEIVAEFPSELMEGDVLLSVSTNNKLTNGTFDTNLDGWTIDGSTTTGVTGDSGTARIGQPGTPGIAVFSQRFDITKKKVLISFDYEWQAVQPSTEDVFMVELIYESTSRPVITELLLQGSDSANFNTPASFSRIVSLADMDVVSDIGEIRFTLSENNTPVGTRVQLDNVSVHQVSDFDAWNLTIGGANGAPC